MNPLIDWLARARNLLFGAQREREHQDEVQFHLDMSAARFERDGHSRTEARRLARLAFGSVAATREAARDARGATFVPDLWRDITYGARQLRHSPAFTAAAVVTLALGIGASTALYSVFDGVLRRPIPFAAPDRLVMVWETDRTSGTTREPGSWPDYLDIAAGARTLRGVAALTGLDVSFVPAKGEPQRLPAVGVTHTFFPLVGVRAIAGRTIVPDDDVPGAAPVVVLGERFWRARFNADRGIIGQVVRLDDTPRTVVGVVGGDADFGLDQVHARAAYHAPYSAAGDVAVWIPLQASESTFPRDTHPFFLLARLADGATREAAADDVAAIARRLEAAYRSNRGRGVFLEPFEDVVFAPVRPVFLLLLAAVVLVLVVTCVNVANLLLARGGVRSREVAVRAALGASPRRLGRQFLVESLLLSLVGGTLGTAVAWGALRALRPFVPPATPRASDIQLDLPVLLAAFITSLIVGVAFGLLPIAQALRVNVNGTLKGEGRGGTSGVRRRQLREVLVVGEIALSVMLVVGAGLLVRSVWSVLRVDAGFSAEGVLKAEWTLPEARYPRDYRRFPDWPATQRFADQVLQRVRALPGVQSAAIASAHPLDAGFTNSFVVVGREGEARDWPEIAVRQVSPSYRETLRGRLVRGRDLGEGDVASAPLVAVINQAAVDRYFAGREPLGAEIKFWGIARRIVGVVGDERVRGPTEPAPPAMYIPIAQAPTASGALLVRTTRPLADVGVEVQQAVWAVDPQLAVHGVEPLEETMLHALGSRRFATVVLSAFAALTLALALVGIHGVLSYATSQRSREIGIRLALGATRREAAGLVVRGGARLAAVGTAIGLVGAALASRLLMGLLFGVTRSDPVTYIAVAATVVAAALAATAIPAFRAAHVVPTEALRLE